MRNLKILNKKEIKGILALIKKQWDAKIDLDYAFLQDKENKIYIINKDFAKIQLDKLRINNIGLYFGQIRNNELRLSIEGSQLIGKEAKNNVLEITKEQSRDWLRGEDLEIEQKIKGFVLLKHNNDFFGTGKVKDNKILNFVPKGRRIRISE